MLKIIYDIHRAAEAQIGSFERKCRLVATISTYKPCCNMYLTSPAGLVYAAPGHDLELDVTWWQ